MIGTPYYGRPFSTAVALESVANPGRFLDAPALAAGDVQVSKDGGAYANIASLPTISPAGSEQLAVSLSAAEMTADLVAVRFRDQDGPLFTEHRLEIATIRLPQGKVLGSPITPTATNFGSDLTDPDNQFNGLFVYFVTGANAGMSRRVNDPGGYANANGEFNLGQPLRVAPSDGDEFIILGRQEP